MPTPGKTTELQDVLKQYPGDQVGVVIFLH